MKKKIKQNNSGIRVCDSIVMSVKNKNVNLRLLESIIIAITGYVSTIMVFLTMFEFNYNSHPVIISAVIFSAAYIIMSYFKKSGLWFILGSILFAVYIFWKKMGLITLGYKFVYNTIYKAAYHTELNYYKFLDNKLEAESITTFFILAVWLIALVIYVFTIYHPHPLPCFLVSFPILEIGLYNGIDVKIFWGMLVIAFLVASFAMSTIDMGEYSGGTGGFVRKGNMFIPKRQMRLKVTEKCGFYIMILVMIFTGISVLGIKISGYERSKELNAKRSEIRDAVNNFSTDNLAESISELSAAFGLEFKVETHKLGTVSVMKYKNSDDLKVTIDKPTDNAVYLKEYTCAVYGDNEWNSLPNSAYNVPLFDEFKQRNVYPQDFPHRFNLTLDRYNGDYSMNIKNLIKGNRSFSPYGTDNLGGLVYDRDLTVSSKKRNKKEYSYKFTNANAENIAMYLGSSVRNVVNLELITDETQKKEVIDYCTERGLLEYDNYINIDSELQLPPQLLYENPGLITTQLLESEYKDFVYENYLAVPDDINMAEVREEFIEILELANPDNSVGQKLSTLYAIRDAIADSAEYSLAPGKTPNNRDFVNYFLLENNKGYCTHYATAGVILARMAGIPARYTAGYVLVTDDFNSSAKNDDGTYTITLKDNRRHAWAEIYLDGYGWVPFEFTEGYTQQTIDTSPTTTTTTTTETTTTTTVETSVTTEQSEESSEHSSENTANTNKNTETQTTAALTSPDGDGEGGNNGNSAMWNLISNVLIQILYFAVFIALILIIIILRRKIIVSTREKNMNQKNQIKSIGCIYDYAIKLLKFKNIETDNMTYTEIARFVEEKYGDVYFESGEFESFINTALISVFSEKTPPKEDVVKSCTLINTIAEKIYNRAKRSEKLYLKYILCLI